MKIAIVTALSIATIAAFSLAAQAQTASSPPVPRPAAGSLPPPGSNPAPTVRTFRTQTAEEQRLSQQTTPIDVGPVGQARCAEGCR